MSAALPGGRVDDAGCKYETGACWVNGERSETIPALDRGLHYGDGLFEVMPVRDGGIPLCGFHLERLSHGCRQLMLPRLSMGTVINELMHAAEGRTGAVLRLVVTRGRGGVDYRQPAEPHALRIMSLHPGPEDHLDWTAHGIHVRICETRLGHNRRLAGVKHLNRLEQVLAQSEWSAADEIQEGLMLDADGAVIGGTSSNVFAWLPHGVLATPSLRLCGVSGVMRRHILEQAEQAKIPVRIATLSLAELMQASELFVCNSIMGVRPIRAIGHWKYAVGSMTRLAQSWASAC